MPSTLLGGEDSPAYADVLEVSIDLYGSRRDVKPDGGARTQSVSVVDRDVVFADRQPSYPAVFYDFYSLLGDSNLCVHGGSCALGENALLRPVKCDPDLPSPQGVSPSVCPEIIQPVVIY